ncbi:hypothetical protein DAH51_06200 [Sphingobium yanoikuyae]|uniref:Peptidase M10 serralysin C-terminal domain-containing protein n=2 Tax=Sphingobium yanoikuyae TaxID=13690 RepID=A0A430C4I8_SPHYA|nr:hypothetical protein DAH51_06200 [Sphingobium yanoikuyae]
MFNVTGQGPAKAKLTPDYSSPIFAPPSSLAAGAITWQVSHEAMMRSEVRLLYPQDGLFAPDDPPAATDTDPTKPAENGSASVAVSQTATGDAKIDGILIGTKWSAGITYSDVDSPADYQAVYSADNDGDGVSAQNEGFSQFTAQQTLAMHSALNASPYTQLPAAWGFSVEAFTNLDITYLGSGDGSATIRAANSSDAGTAYAYYPNSSIYGGDTFFGNAYDGTSNSLKNPVAGNYAWHTMLHELGHSLGLKHGQSLGGPANVALPTQWDSIEFSVMTYRSYVGDPLVGGYSYEQWGAPQTYMMLDIAALQTLYGADYTVQSGNTVYSWNPTTGETLINGGLAIDPGGNRIFATIWDGGGIDTYDLSNYTTDLSIDLTPGGHSTFSTVQLAYLGDGHYARGNIFNALLYQGNSASMIENATGGSGDDSISGNDLDNVLNGGDGNDYLFGGYGDDTLSGGAGDDVIDGSYGFDLIYGGSGNDIIYGSWTTDTVYGDSGNDVFIIRQTSTDTEYGDNTYGGTGVDRLDLSQISSTYGAIVDLAAGTWQYNPLYGGPWTINSVENVDGTQLDDVLTGSASANVLNGNGGNDRIYGGAGNDVINGGSGDDLLVGGSGNDVFDGGSGTDLIYGEAGNDTFLINNGWTGSYGEVFVGGSGSDTFDISAVIGFATTTINLTDGEFTYTPVGGGPISLSSIENVVGSDAADSITGSGEVNRLSGNAGADALYGLAGDDWLDGGAGDDLIDGGTGADTASYGSASAAVTVSLALSTAQATGGAGSDTLTGVENLAGSAYADTLAGNAADNSLFGGGGNDSLNGGDGNDILNGEAGADTMTGGLGNDIFYVDNVSDKVIESATGGTDDRIFSSVTYSLSGRYVETLTLTGSANINATGNSLAQTLNGNSGNNSLSGLAGDDILNGYAGIDLLDGGDGNDVLDGGTGADSMAGGAGNDIYYVDDSGDDVIEGSTGGTDDRIFSSTSYSLAGRYVENLTLTGTAAISATGNSLAQTLTGNSGDNSLWGMDGDDLLNGGAGNDLLDGGGGNDVMDGGTGSDTASYAAATAAVTVSLALAGAQATGGAGSDTLSNIENLTGSAFADTLTGNAGANILNGGAGADVLTGGDGNDVYYVDNVGDDVVEGSTGGSADSIVSSVTYSLGGRYVETLTLTGSANINATGNGQANTLIGNSGKNVLNSSSGNDLVDGKLGADTLTGGAGADIFLFSSTLGSGNIDNVTDYAVADDVIQLDDAVFAGLTLGGLAANAFYIGAAAHDADDRIIYNSATGALLFDADGNGAGAAVQFATLTTSLALAAGEFVVV